MSTNLEHHITILGRVCRLCSHRVQDRRLHAKQYKPKLRINYADKILNTFGVDIQTDEADIHPPHMCHTCYCKFFHPKKWTATVNWAAHPRTGPCKVCNEWANQCKGGGNMNKRRNYNNPAQPAKRPALPSDINPGPKIPHLDPRFEFEVLEEFRCGICGALADEALKSTCDHLLCLKCLQNVTEDSVQCKMCSKSFPISDGRSLDTYLQNVATILSIKCSMCKTSMPIRDSVKHSCTQDALSILQRPLDEPLTPAMEAIGSHILKSKLKQSDDGATVSFKTGGQVCNLHCILPSWVGL
ncbi:V(D)J recombination activating protein 1 [Holothuria leucospilota]|uniref:V(D)J recombination activating protein 1 n=1 Tax=Holothuria leucospilota TaxID=206669 RepID=A0A9Q0YEM9_HOLLE|nr:V(D)J recombination activating protein 1 [Holothuria leucospilota]